MNNSVSGVALVEQWRNGRGLNNPAGSLFAAGEFAQADIVNVTARTQLLSLHRLTHNTVLLNWPWHRVTLMRHWVACFLPLWTSWQPNFLSLRD